MQHDSAPVGLPKRLPSVSVVVPTHQRERSLSAAVASILDQDYPGIIEVIVVYDGQKPNFDHRLAYGNRIVRVIENARTPGLAGARNSGIDVAEGELIAFCDDDDAWRPEKLGRQVAALRRAPDAYFATCGITLEYGDRRFAQPATVDRLEHDHLLTSRVAWAHSSTFLFRRRMIPRLVAPVDETLPLGQAEDYDLLLRATKIAPLVVVTEPLVDVGWHKTNWLNERWTALAAALQQLTEKHPDLLSSRTNAGRMFGQIAFAHAASGNLRSALPWMARSLAADPTQPRPYMAALVGSKVIPLDPLLHAVKSTGHGI